MSDDEDADSWEVTGAFPTMSSPSSSQNHIFTDEPYDNEFSSLEIVEEGSKETPDTSREDAMAVSIASSDTPAIDNRVDAAMRTVLGHQKHQTAANASSSLSQGGSSDGGSSVKAIYPFNVYESITRLGGKKKKRVEEAALSPPLQNQPPAANTSFNSASTSSRSSHNQRKIDIEDANMPSPMTMDEEPSVISETQSLATEAAINNPTPQSLVSAARSRHNIRRYMVKHTLSTSQQITTNPNIMLKNLFIGIEQERHMHKLAGQNLHAVHDWLLFLPCILLTLLSGIVVLIFEADLNTSNSVRVYSSLFVGVAALVSVFLQAVSKMLDMNTRGTLHAVTANILKRLSEDILLNLSSTDKSIPAEYVALVSDKLGQALDACPCPVPYKLEAAFSSISDRMVLMLKPPTGQPARKYVHKLDFMRLYATAYDELSSEIIHFWAWPFLIPRPRTASEAALRNFKAIVTEGRDAVHRKQGCVRFFCCLCIGKEEKERSLFEVVPAASIAEASSYTANSHYPYAIRNAMLGQEV